MRVAVGYQEGIALTGKAAHAAIGAAFDTDPAPEVLVSEEYTQYTEGTCAGALGRGITSGAADKLHLSGSGQALILFDRNGIKEGKVFGRFRIERRVEVCGQFLYSFQNLGKILFRGSAVKGHIVGAEDQSCHLLQGRAELFCRLFGNIGILVRQPSAGLIQGSIPFKSCDHVVNDACLCEIRQCALGSGGMSRRSKSCTHTGTLFLKDFKDPGRHVVIGIQQNLTDQFQSFSVIFVKSLDADFKSQAVFVPGCIFLRTVPVVSVHNAADSAGTDVDLMAERGIAVGFSIQHAEKCLENSKAADIFLRQVTNIEQEGHVIDPVGKQGMRNRSKYRSE